MILSLNQIEEIALSVTSDFNKFLSNGEKRSIAATHETPIEILATDYLGLNVSYTKLSTDGSILGITAYTDTQYLTEDHGRKRIVTINQNQVLLDSSFAKLRQPKTLNRVYRFTLAHECAHQILFQLESDCARESYQKQYAERTAYSLRDLKVREDWNEWQANALGAAILMPQPEIISAVQFFIPNRVITSYGGRFNYTDHLALRLMCDSFKVSKTALTIRLRHLGYIEDRPYSEFHDPKEVWP